MSPRRTTTGEPGGNPESFGERLASAGLAVAGGQGGGLTIARLERGGLAADAGLRRGDEIVSINGRDVANLNDLQEALNDIPSGSPLEVLVQRNGRMIRTEIEAEPAGGRR